MRCLWGSVAGWQRWCSRDESYSPELSATGMEKPKFEDLIPTNRYLSRQALVFSLGDGGANVITERQESCFPNSNTANTFAARVRGDVESCSTAISWIGSSFR